MTKQIVISIFLHFYNSSHLCNTISYALVLMHIGNLQVNIQEIYTVADRPIVFSVIKKNAYSYEFSLFLGVLLTSSTLTLAFVRSWAH